jgi:hypothetical protein
MDREKLPMVYLAYVGTAPPEEYGIRYQEAPTFGAVTWPPKESERLPDDARQVLAVSVTNLQGAYLLQPGPYRPFYARPPKAKIGYSIWIYDLTGDAEAHEDLAAVYRWAAQREDAQQRDLTAREYRELAAREELRARQITRGNDQASRK